MSSKSESENTDYTFFIKHTFDNPYEADESIQLGGVEEHGGDSWQLSIEKQEDETLSISAQCAKHPNDFGWFMKLHVELRFYSNSTEFEFHQFTFDLNDDDDQLCITDYSEENLKGFFVGGKLTIELAVKVKESGCCERLRDFQVEEFTDVTLMVQGAKFCVLKMYLASHSSYFNSLFFGEFEEQDKDEIELKDINPKDFQYFLEVIHGEDPINENNVEPILTLADMFESETTMRRCENFMIKDGDMNIERKLRLSLIYKLDKLRTECLHQISDGYSIQNVINAMDPCDVEHHVWKELLMKALTLAAID